MSDVVVKTPLQYLDSAMGALRNLGLTQDKPEETPIVKYHSVSSVAYTLLASVNQSQPG